MIKPILITPGDAAGIGPEIAIKAYHELKNQYPLECVGPEWLWQQAADLAQCAMPEKLLTVPALAEVAPFQIEYAKVSALLGKIAVEAIKSATTACMAGQALALVTAPITKVGIHQAGYKYAGHTDLLADLTQVDASTMMMSTDALKVILVTHHISLLDAILQLTTSQILEKIIVAQKTGQQAQIKRPKIAVCGLNPHASENSAFGNQEELIIAPAIELAQQQNIDVTGPYPSDTLFYRARQGEFDFVIALYHDQGLIPIKINGFKDVVNTTLSLPIVRTSPGHGSAYDIAGQNKADINSIKSAIKMAAKLASR